MSISQYDFESACEQLRDRWQLQTTCNNWQDVKILEDLGRQLLRITCVEQQNHPVRYADQDGDSVNEAALDEEDAEALPTADRPSKQTLILYDITHSPSYQVPVLYVTFRDLSTVSRGLPPPEQAYEMLVPSSYRQEVERIGPMGALSMTDHPISSTPAYFVHPCRTAEAMEGANAGQEVSPAGYLIRWIGTIGASVGLTVPLQLAQDFDASRDKR